tara:strand:+ start:156 stop:644 length:489 start_codon:yes stop_codon:yes gene_type:complete
MEDVNGSAMEYLEKRNSLYEFVDEVRRLTELDDQETPTMTFLHMISEIGEVAEVLAAETGSLTKGNKVYKETAKEEMVDVIQCAISHYFALGGDVDHLVDYGKIKNKKWETAFYNAKEKEGSLWKSTEKKSKSSKNPNFLKKVTKNLLQFLSSRSKRLLRKN